ncbi:MAG: hydroxymethylglutaryl-CoA lyase [Phycisphaerales bacterium]|nr:MAG: hydroxymethylglutaryl-CoA lyase [Phycisphaerales bacterium]
MNDRIRITDVAPRDGLQNEAARIPTEDKARLVRALLASGVDEVEVSSFVSPKWIPQLGDAAELFAMIAPDSAKRRQVVLSTLVPNEKGAQAAIEVNQAAARVHGLDRLIAKLSVFTAASETFSKRNTNATIAEAIERFVPVASIAREHGLRLRGYVSCAIRCPFEGDIKASKVVDVAAKLLEIGCDEIDFGDTIGAGTPETVGALCEVVRTELGDDLLRDPERCTLHLHDTFGHATACAVEAARLGVRSFDSAAGGLGGCPYASTPERRAPGNVATDALTTALRDAGYTINIDDAGLAEASTIAREIVAGARPTGDAS